ncbi:MAG: glutamine-hydrolyzing carbamoyl-phosphate synthase small subunit [Candidatus Woesearchaeota archaeon]|jgi:carbamoyl-phosphate synthase small subunit|nr:glutamine-hydrolyzing carbamoyl-phosphate synthase small subunit [Candidatus Woesearchaeota archaeon]MDP7622895.1 glutamine-hydrolyzing carbamoyl-phosphate synthase small subunit [Candidatus Woesearchaeota archaeon]HJN57098.1 glutamine-hydrolyzing carbamoyl-phosphate synthase small subunit [Candidatus Woesearchaeota archaeon]|tara:strand:- start:10146 stop:11234 length:1089 start_codon:yes stop_codon:yes gene_type:complete
MLLKKNAKLVLEDGSIFYGHSFASDISVSGEVVFSTGMVGYPESLTDPSYKGQILCLTYPLIGNYGIPSNDTDNHGLLKNFESDKIHIRGLVISDYSSDYSHWNAKKSLGEWLKEHNIPGIFDIDTRELTKKLREKGTMLGKIVINDEDVKLYDPNKIDLVKEVSINKPCKYTCKNNNADTKNIILIDCGAKYNIIRCFLKRNVNVIRVPYDYDFFNEKFDGILISNGPGNPKMCKKTIENIKKAIKQEIPVMGICLGNQLLALAAGADTYKLKYGHRSQNQPCLMQGTKRCFITTQNHGFAVKTNSLQEDWEPWFTNINDNTNEGIKHKTKPFMSVQFHPEAAAGPVDTEFLFDEFIEKLK